jgi:PAS domain S-box-containing protein
MFGNDSKLKELMEQQALELRASEARFHNIVTISSDGIVIVDGVGAICFVNPAAESLFSRNAKELLGEQFGFPIVAGKTTELDIVHKGKKQAIVELQVVTTEWEGKAAYLVTLRDITERRHAEQELRKLYRAMMQSPAIVMITDRQGIIEYVNPKFTETTGYLPVEVLGKNPSILKSGKTSPEEYKKIWESITAGKEWHGEFINRKKNGELYHEASSIAPVADLEGTITHFVAVMEDITERKLAEEALRESEALFRVIFDQAFQLMGLMNPDGTLIKINRKAAEFIETEESDVLGKHFWETPWWTHSPEQQERLRIAVNAAAQGEFARFEATHRTPAGEFVWVDFSLKPVTDQDGRVIYLVPEGRDISAFKQAQEKIELLNSDLASRAAELEAFNYTVSHDLRQPLNIINGYCQAVDTLCSDQLQEDCRSYIQEVYNGTVRMNLLIEALLNFSRMGHVEPSRVMVELSSLAREVTLSLEMTEPDRQVDFRISDGIVANADASLLRIVLENLLGNAWKYTELKEKAIIELGVTHIDRAAVYFVRDNGAGFDKADADKLFVPFQRLPGAEKFKGSGIGLATVERIIRSHGGKIWAEGEPGKGATFYFTLPAVQISKDTA